MAAVVGVAGVRALERGARSDELESAFAPWRQSRLEGNYPEWPEPDTTEQDWPYLVGLDTAEVRAILGPPESRDGDDSPGSGVRRETWTYEPGYLCWFTVFFADGVVVEEWSGGWLYSCV